MMTAARRTVAAAALVAASAATTVLAAPAADAASVTVDSRNVMTVYLDLDDFSQISDHSGGYLWGVCGTVLDGAAGHKDLTGFDCTDAVLDCVRQTLDYNYSNGADKLPVVMIWPNNAYSCYSG